MPWTANANQRYLGPTISNLLRKLLTLIIRKCPKPRGTSPDNLDAGVLPHQVLLQFGQRLFVAAKPVDPQPLPGCSLTNLECESRPVDAVICGAS